MKKFKKRSYAKLAVGSLCLVGAVVTCQKGTELCEIYYSINILVNTLDLIAGFELVLNFT